MNRPLHKSSDKLLTEDKRALKRRILSDNSTALTRRCAGNVNAIIYNTTSIATRVPEQVMLNLKLVAMTMIPERSGKDDQISSHTVWKFGENRSGGSCDNFS